MKKPLVIGNWKAYLTSQKACVALLKAVTLASTKKFGTYGFAVPDIFLAPLQALKTKALLGIQNIGEAEAGAHTGKNLASMAASVKADFTILGHSEVRSNGETNEVVNAKIQAAFKEKLHVVLCVGEHSRDKNGTYLTYIEDQLKACLTRVDPKDYHLLTIAYEPIWAVGASTSASPEECFEAIIIIRRTLATLGNIAHAKKVLVLYGGTVTKENAAHFISDGGADGLLVGRASTNVKEFTSILHAVYA
jgi:triosephosphate isomerase